MAPKLLLADDSITIQRVIELTFADEHIQVIAVGDGAQAIARIESERPDVVLADVGMPEKDGYEVAAYVKSQPHLRHIPVVLLTGAFEPVDEARAHAIGCDGVLGKPFEPQMVIGRVKDLLAGRRPPALWATAPGQPSKPAERPAQPADQPHVDYKNFAANAAAPDTPPAASTDSLDEYFDRLDAAFASIGAEEPAAPSAPATEPAVPVEPARAGAPAPPVDQVELVKPGSAGDAFSDVLDRWDPSLSDEEPPAATAFRTSAGSPAPMVPTPARPAGQRPPAASPLSDAFAALLAAEEAPAPAPAAPAPAPMPAPARAPVAAPAAASVQGLVVDDALIETIVQRVIERLTTNAAQDTVLQVAERLVREEIQRIKSQAH